MRKFFDILDYGAQCNGRDDDSIPVQAANNAAAEWLELHPEDEVFVRYPSTGITLCGGVVAMVSQAGSSAKVRLPNGSNNYIFAIASDNVRFIGLHMNGAARFQDKRLSKPMVVAPRLFERCEFNSCLFKDCWKPAIQLKDETMAWTVGPDPVDERFLGRCRVIQDLSFVLCEFEKLPGNFVHVHNTRVAVARGDNGKAVIGGCFSMTRCTMKAIGTDRGVPKDDPVTVWNFGTVSMDIRG